MSLPIILRGGGDLASGVAMRLLRAGLRPLVTELAQPLVVRRRVAFAEAVFAGSVDVEDVTGRRVPDLPAAAAVSAALEVPVLVDPQLCSLAQMLAAAPGSGWQAVLIDGRMRKLAPEPVDLQRVFVIGLGPGFSAGLDCHAVIETNRGHRLGRVIWQGQSEPDTGVPEWVGGHGVERVVRAPADGVMRTLVRIGDLVAAGQPLAEVAGQAVTAPFDGAVRGLLRDGLSVTAGLKIGDVDPRRDPQYCYLVSDKSLAVGGAVLEALLTLPEIRSRLWKD